MSFRLSQKRKAWLHKQLAEIGWKWLGARNTLSSFECRAKLIPTGAVRVVRVDHHGDGEWDQIAARVLHILKIGSV